MFAHNGELPEIMNHDDFQLKWYFPKGETDSEFAFCFIMDRLRKGGSQSTDLASANVLGDIHAIARQISTLGRFNFLLSDSEHLIAYNDYWDNDELHYVLRSCPCGENGALQHVAVIATNPTTNNENWVKMKTDELIIFSNGIVS